MTRTIQALVVALLTGCMQQIDEDETEVEAQEQELTFPTCKYLGPINLLADLTTRIEAVFEPGQCGTFPQKTGDTSYVLYCRRPYAGKWVLWTTNFTVPNGSWDMTAYVVKDGRRVYIPTFPDGYSAHGQCKADGSPLVQAKMDAWR